ncbi:hypothetical protein DPMN_064704 [Dreissena polymorpha]|uniref:Uncharacterized protein n=1 Tax=Dreissena polymorpha TaxID=45954 RepID=A0A9D4CDT4_DREPO|nr:hypothetical protein DPMN_064704 [Dreissena polymorpha]
MFVWTISRTCQQLPPTVQFAHLRGTNILVNSHVIQLTRTIFELNSCIKETNVLSKFHENWAKNVTSSVFTYINKTNVLTNFHDDWPKIVTSRVLTRENCHYIHIETNFQDHSAKNVTSRVFTRKTAPPTGGHVFQRIGTTFELNQDIIKKNILTNDLLLTKFHEDGTRNVVSRVFTSKSKNEDLK